MARFTKGWVKLYRELLGTDIAKHPTRLSLFIHLVAMANVEDSWVEWKGKPRLCPRGSLVTSMRELADIIGGDRKTVERQLKYLALRETVVVESDPRGSFVTIQNYSEYQDSQADGVQQTSNRRPSSTPTGGATGGAYKKEVKNQERRSRRNGAQAAPAAAAFPFESSECGAVPELSKSKEPLFLSALNTVTQSVQRTWIERWETDFVMATGEKCVLKSIANGSSPQGPWDGIITSWLFREKPQVLRKGSAKYWEPPPQEDHEGPTAEELMQQYGATDMLDLMAKMKEKNAS